MYISFKEFINYKDSAFGYTCYECKMWNDNFPLSIKHTKNCTTPKRIELYQTEAYQEMVFILENKQNIINQIKGLEKEKLKLLRQKGILENDPKWINDYIEALYFLNFS